MHIISLLFSLAFETFFRKTKENKKYPTELHRNVMSIKWQPIHTATSLNLSFNGYTEPHHII